MPLTMITAILITCLSGLAGADAPAALALAPSVRAESGATAAPAPTDADRELLLRAAFLLNFTKFTTWPESAFESPTAPVVVAIVGDDPFGSILERTFRDETVRGRAIAVRRIAVPVRSAAASDAAHAEAVAACAAEIGRAHLAYFQDSMSSAVAVVIASIESSTTVTVGDRRAAAERHTAFALDRDGDRIAIHAHVRRIERLSVQVSSRLLGLARVIDGDIAPRSGGRT